MSMRCRSKKEVNVINSQIPQHPVIHKAVNPTRTGAQVLFLRLNLTMEVLKNAVEQHLCPSWCIVDRLVRI